MKIFHLSDLHIGKQLNGYSLKENQEAVLKSIIEEAGRRRPDVILVCGDIYDKTIPSGEAYQTFNRFLEGLGELEPAVPTLIIGGNHDSPERLEFAASFLEKHHIVISSFPPDRPGEYLKKVVLEDEYGTVNFYMLPFLKPGYVRKMIEEEKGLEKTEKFGYEEAIKALLKRENIDFSKRNVLLSHQFYMSGHDQPQTCDSELAVAAAGGLDGVDIGAVEMFDYVALGHLHGFQAVGREHICYSGSIFKYSVSEERHKKGILSVTLSRKGEPVEKERIFLSGLQNVRKEKGTLEEVLGRTQGERRHDFVSITLTDEKENYNFREKLEEVYPYILDIKIDNERTRRELEGELEEIRKLSPLESFCQFYETVCSRPISQEEKQVIKEIAAGLEGGAE